MTTPYQKVKEFMQLFKQACPPSPIIPPLEVRKLRARLILEEALETIEALGVHFTISTKNPFLSGIVMWSCGDLSFDFQRGNNPDIVKVLDGICDVDYVNKGLAISMGIPEDNLDGAFAEVHRSNMSKMWSEEQVAEGKLKYPTAIIEHYGGGLYRFILDGKVIKSPTYSPASLEQFLYVPTHDEKGYCLTCYCNPCQCTSMKEGFKERTIFIEDGEVFPYCGKCQHQPCTCGFMKDEP